MQGVGFRPTVWRLARDCGLRGSVRNDGRGVSITAWGTAQSLENFIARLHTEAPPLARIDTITRTPLTAAAQTDDFVIELSHAGEVRTAMAPDAATCPACLAEVLDPANRRHRYPFTNCTHCGPRLSIVTAIPYDRANTSMAVFSQCPACAAEYDDPADRRFHAQPNACPECGPRLWLENADGQALLLPESIDAVDHCATLIREGHIVAIKGIGGIHLACDAGNDSAVTRLRQRKRRYHKAFALMARDVDMVRRYAKVNEQEAALLQGVEAPIVVLDKLVGCADEGSASLANDALPSSAHPAYANKLAGDIAPGQQSLGFMLPYTPLHHLLMGALEHPIVLTSGNRSDEPQCTGNADARERLTGIADYLLLHDRDIVNRLDDSVLRVAAGRPRMLRRARGYAPAPFALPAGFENAPPVLAMGGELKNTFCLLQDGKAIVSQHMGDLEDARTQRDYRHHLQLYASLFDHRPQAVAVDAHPNYLSTQRGHEFANARDVPLISVQHHHAHIASCMAEHGLPMDSPPVLGIALDGLGFGDDGTLWGGEFLRADYNHYQRLARFAPVPMLGGAQAMREPWRNTYAHLAQALGWETVKAQFAQLEIVGFLNAKPLATLDAMMARGLNSPRASSAGRLFDAAAAALGLCRESVAHEGQAAMELETLAQAEFGNERHNAYPVAVIRQDGVRTLAWAPLWSALLTDLAHDIPPAIIAARFHWAVAEAVSRCAAELCAQHNMGRVVLGGGVFQNRLLLEGVQQGLLKTGLEVLAPEQLPANDGGLCLGQAVVAAARAGSA